MSDDTQRRDAWREAQARPGLVPVEDRQTTTEPTDTEVEAQVIAATTDGATVEGDPLAELRSEVAPTTEEAA